VRARRWPAAVAMLGGCGRGLAVTGRTAVFARQGDADQPLDVAQIFHLLGIAISLIAGAEEMEYLRDIERLMRWT